MVKPADLKVESTRRRTHQGWGVTRAPPLAACRCTCARAHTGMRSWRHSDSVQPTKGAIPGASCMHTGRRAHPTHSSCGTCTPASHSRIWGQTLQGWQQHVGVHLSRAPGSKTYVVTSGVAMLVTSKLAMNSDGSTAGPVPQRWGGKGGGGGERVEWGGGQGPPGAYIYVVMAIGIGMSRMVMVVVQAMRLPGKGSQVTVLHLPVWAFGLAPLCNAAPHRAERQCPLVAGATRNRMTEPARQRA